MERSGGRMFESIENIRKLRKKYNAKMYLSGNETFKALAELESSALRSGTIPQKYKELIALGISIAEDCYG
jgi:alkylhydroperoxidase/carboxymuconolactone decarboxylase family protein YurZ